MKTTAPITYLYEFNDHLIKITRSHAGTAYPRNGNVGNATEYFTWSAWTIYGVASNCATRASAYEHARAMILGQRYYDHPNFPTRWVNVRNWLEVKREMKANYRSTKAVA